MGDAADDVYNSHMRDIDPGDLWDDLPDIITYYDPKPIPLRRYDWSAARDGYEPGDPIGWGATEAEAIEDLMERERERG